MKKKFKFKYPKQTRLQPLGVGSTVICNFKYKFGINKNIRIKKFIQNDKIKWMFNNFLFNLNKNKEYTRFLSFYKNYEEEKKNFLNFLMLVQNYRGIRYKTKLPMRGQRTKTNAKTRSKRISRRQKRKLK